MLKRFIAPIILLFGLIGAPGASAQSSEYGLPEKIQDGNILHLFCWSSSQAIAMLPDIAEAGFGAIQISPVQGNASTNAEWFYAYMPYDFNFRGTGAATTSNGLKNLCAEAHKYGIKVIVDVVANHINGSTSNRNSWWNTNDRLRSTTVKVNYGNRNSITHHRLGDYPDVNSESAEVQERAVEFVKTLAEYGVDGIRWDAAKHISLPSENCDFWTAVTSAVPGLYHYGEILDTPGGSNANNLMKEYTNYMSVTDTRYSNSVLGSVRGGSVPSSKGSWSYTIPENKIIYWGESHDTYANDGGDTKFVDQAVIDRAWAIVACRDGGSALYLSRPLKTGYTEIKMGVKGSTNFTSPEIVAVNKFRNAMRGKADAYASSNGVACITRQGGGAVIVVGKGGVQNVTVDNASGYCPAGTYTDMVSGRQFTVTNSKITGTTGPSGIAVLMNGEQGGAPVVFFTPEGCTFRGETLDINVELVNAASGSLNVTGLGEITLAPGSTNLTIGEGVDFNSEILVKWEAKAADGKSASGSQTYKKLDPKDRPADMPSEFYIMGQVNGNSWDPAVGCKMEEDGATFTANVTIQSAFSFASALGAAGNWNSFNAMGVRYGASGSDKTLTLGATAPLVKLNDPKAYKLSGGVAGTTYTIVVDWLAKTVSICNLSGIGEVEIEEIDAPVEFYTLQGVRVDNPSAPGLYIRRQGRDVSKVMIR
ncbi:MAG: hypothetical protein K2L96_01410 [Muribaculaceae bacterium]|nr:hypothetical protein [Muribaculaceae bacterium]